MRSTLIGVGARMGAGEGLESGKDVRFRAERLITVFLWQIEDIMTLKEQICFLNKLAELLMSVSKIVKTDEQVKF